MITAFCRRLGIDAGWADAPKFTETLLKALRGSDLDFEAVFFDWYGGSLARQRAESSKRGGQYKSRSFTEAAELLAAAPAAPDITADHAYFDRPDPLTLHIEEVEAVWAPIARHDDWQVLQAALADIHQMADAYQLSSHPPAVRIN